MSLTVPNLDDRSWAELVEEARRRVMTICPDWTDLTPHDPGMVLLELFAFLTDTMISRLNRLPEKAYVEFLRLIGVRIHPPSAAHAALAFSRIGAAEEAITIPRGTRVSVSRASGGGEPPVFITAENGRARRRSGSDHGGRVPLRMVDGELIGLGTGLPGLSLAVLRPPVVAPTTTGQDLSSACRRRRRNWCRASRRANTGASRSASGAEVDTFAAVGDDPYAYVVDRAAGTVTFAPAIQLRRDDGTLAGRRARSAPVPAARARDSRLVLARRRAGRKRRRGA